MTPTPPSPEPDREHRRQAARRNLVDYARFIEVPGAPRTDDEDTEGFAPVETALAAHHVLTLEACQRCVEMPGGRLMLFMPPGSAKSTYGSVVLPSFVMGAIPNSSSYHPIENVMFHTP